MRYFLIWILTTISLFCSKSTAEIELTNRILNGHQAPPNFAPYYAAIFGSINGLPVYQCGGAIIHANWILTTATKCAAQQTNIQIRVGSQKLITNLKMYNTSYVILHPKYSILNSVNNIALIRLSEPLKLTASVSVIDLNQDELASSAIGILVGFGYFGNVRPTDLQVVYQRIINYDDCREKYYMNSANFTVGNICAYIPEQSACSKDEGSPLTSLSRDKLIGLSSWIYQDRCDTDVPNVFTEIRYYVDWIESIIRS